MPREPRKYPVPNKFLLDNPAISRLYDEWLAQIMVEGKQPGTLVNIEYRNVLLPKLLRADRENRDVQLVSSADLSQYPGLKMLTLEVRFFGGDPPAYTQLLVRPIEFNAIDVRVPDEVLSMYGFLLSSPTYDLFINLLYAQGASEVLEIMGGLHSHDWVSGLRRIEVKKVGERPYVPDQKPVLITEQKFQLQTQNNLLSHPFLRLTLRKTEDDYSFVSPAPMSDAVRVYLDNAEQENDCFYRAFIQTYKADWDKAWAGKLDHASLRKLLGKTAEDDWSVTCDDIARICDAKGLNCVMFDVRGKPVWHHYQLKRKRSKELPVTFYLVAHNSHVWPIEDNRAMGQNPSVKSREVFNQMAPIPAPSPYYVITDDEKSVITYQLCERIDEVDTAIRSHKAGRLNLHFKGDMTALLFHFVFKKNVQPHVYTRTRALSGMSIHLEHGDINIVDFSIEGEKLSTDQVRKMLPVYAAVKPKLIRKEFISRYSIGLRTAFKAWFRGPLHRTFGYAEHVQKLDICAAYPAQLETMHWIPGYSELDEFRVYEGQTIEPFGLYIVENADDPDNFDKETWFILNCRWNLVSGYVLHDSGVLSRPNVKIHGWIAPAYLHKNPFREILHEVQEKQMPYRTSKQLLNSLIGLTCKRTHRTERSLVTPDYNQALTFAAGISDNVHTREHDGKTLFTAIAQSEEVSLLDGLYAGIQFHVYDRMRLALHQMYRDLTSRGATVYGVKVDCMTVDAIPSDLPLAPRNDLSKMGQYRQEDGSDLAGLPAELYQNDAPRLLTEEETLSGEWRNLTKVLIFPAITYRELKKRKSFTQRLPSP